MEVLEKARYRYNWFKYKDSAKIVSVAQPNQVLIGESIYDIIFSVEQNNERNFQYNNRFLKVNLDLLKWNYKSNVSGKV